MDSRIPLLLLLICHQPPLITSLTTSTSATCPLNFTILQPFVTTANSQSTYYKCQYTLQAIHLVQSYHLQTTSLFLPEPPTTSTSCWLALQPFLSQLFPSFDPRRDCGFSTDSISQGCMNITTRREFESIVPSSALADVRSFCNQSLANNAPCAACTTSLGRAKAGYLPDPDYGNNVTSCASYPAIYAAGVVNLFGPVDHGTALCLFFLESDPTTSLSASSSPSLKWVSGVAVSVFVVVLVLVAAGILIAIRKNIRRKKKKKIGNSERFLQLETMGDRTNLVRYTIEEIKAATNNFYRENLIGRGGYGNVFKGVLPDGTEVAVKRFKNCTISGDESFAHEVEVIASIHHVNLVALRGYCTAKTALEGHQRIIVCDLIKNGSLHDHLFELQDENRRKLSWPVRRRIAIGMARGLAYLHHGAQPAIIHRDIKASNILLDEAFEPKLADFGLAKFSPEGASHMSTRVAGTLGYVAPEYALYGRLTDKSDVYSFGVLLLEILSGKKAVASPSEGETWHVTEWAWSLVRNGRALDVLEEGMEEMGPEELMEKYVQVAVLCSHPHLNVRPSMDVVLKYLESNVEVPVIPERPISLLSDMSHISRSLSSSGSGGRLCTSAGYQPFTADS